MKKLLSIIIIISIVFQISVFVNAEDTATEHYSNGYMFTVSNGEATVTGCDTSVSGSVIIPGNLEGYPVSAIGEHSFEDRTDITSVSIPDSVKQIENHAFFGCSNLVSISVPDTILYVDLGAFSGTGYYNNTENWTDDSLYLNRILLTVDNYKSAENFVVRSGTVCIAYGAFVHCNRIKNIVLPNGLKTINENAFHYCGGLKSIIIPDTVVYIGKHAFCECRNLENLTLPKNLKYIGDEAFFYCNHLNVPELPDGVEYIGKGAFYRCARIMNINIPDSVTSIENNTFKECMNLKSISIPKTITKIGTAAFYKCENLSDVYFGGSEEEWHNIEYEQGNSCLSLANIHFNDIGISSSATQYIKPERISGTFKSSSDTFVGEAPFYYDEYDFAKSAYTYNHYLAKMSIRLAMSAFAEKSAGYGMQYKNAKDLLDTLKFQNVSWNDNYTKKPSINSIGVIAGHKRISYDDGDYTLIAVAVRGGGYESEWGGNFNVGNEDLHTGFRTARDHVLEFLTDYVSDNSIQGNIKVWITGYSRAAATVNLTAAYLDTHKYIFGSDVTMAPENIYAYCFETPAGVKNPPAEKTYNNIFSIVNRSDFVPMVVMDKWNYGRYGITYYLPSSETNSDYEELKAKMYSRYNDYVTNNYQTHRAQTIEQFSEYEFSWSAKEIYPYWGFNLKKVDKNHYETMGVFLQKVIDGLADTFVSPSSYTNNEQEALIYVGQTIIGEGNAAECINIFKKELISRLSVGSLANKAFDSLFDIFSEKELSGIIYDSTKAAFKELGVTVENDTLDKIVSILIKLSDDNQLATLLGNLEIIPVGHYPELCMAWLDAADETTFTTGDETFVMSQAIKVTLNGAPIVFDQSPIIENERTLVPLRAIFEALGATVDWNNDTQTVTASKGDTVIRLAIGSNVLHVNDTEITLDVPAMLVGERTLVPVRAIAESFDCSVSWDSDTKTVIITE